MATGLHGKTALTLKTPRASGLVRPPGLPAFQSWIASAGHGKEAVALGLAFHGFGTGSTSNDFAADAAVRLEQFTASADFRLQRKPETRVNRVYRILNPPTS
jgi:hypothetical protein